jgi:D-alanyl-D-alanine carboxypeptidase (penicillin-binding protein 5/6)
VDGKAYTIESLFYGLFLRSGNDTAEALARANGGLALTISQMNEMARQLQANDTVAKSPSGLDRPGQVSSAYDLALIARPGRGNSSYAIYNQNRLLTGGYKGAIGIKTGFTTNAGRTLIAAATRKGRTLIFVGLGINSASSDAAATALTWGFKNRDLISPVGTLVEPLTATPSPGRDHGHQRRAVGHGRARRPPAHKRTEFRSPGLRPRLDRGAHRGNHPDQSPPARGPLARSPANGRYHYQLQIPVSGVTAASDPLLRGRISP